MIPVGLAALANDFAPEGGDSADKVGLDACMFETAPTPQTRSAAASAPAAAVRPDAKDESGFQAHLRGAMEISGDGRQVAPSQADSGVAGHSHHGRAEDRVGDQREPDSTTHTTEKGSDTALSGVAERAVQGVDDDNQRAPAGSETAAADFKVKDSSGEVAPPSAPSASLLASGMISRPEPNFENGAAASATEASRAGAQGGFGPTAALVVAEGQAGLETSNAPSPEALPSKVSDRSTANLQLGLATMQGMAPTAMAFGQVADLPSAQQEAITNAQAAAAQVAPDAQAARPNAKVAPATPPKDAAAPTNPTDAVSSVANALVNTEAAAELDLVMEASSAERDLRFVGLEAAPKAAIAKVATEARPEALTMAPLALAPGDSMMPRTEVVFSSAGARELPAPMPARQLAPVVVSLALGRGEEALTVTLDPVELGRVEVSIGQGKEAGQVRIVAERAETLALLQRDQRELDRALNQAGLGDMARSLSFSLASDQGRQQHQQGAAHQGSPQFSGILGGPEADRLIAPTPYPARSATSLLDIAV